MKPTLFNRFFLISTAAGLLAAGNSSAQTVEINPAGAIPAAYTLVPSGTWNWDTDANLESWAVGINTAFVLDLGTPIGGIVTGTSATGTGTAGDARFDSPTTTIATPYRVIVEFRIKKPTLDTSRIDLFWDDSVGGFAAARTYTVQPATFAADGNFKVVRITFPAGRIATQLDQLRLDPTTLIDQAVEIDYLRVYTETLPALTWDPDTVTTGAQGGTGTWNQATTANWWNGSADVVWPGSSSAAFFAGTAGTVTVSGAVNASFAEFQTAGYTLTGSGPLTLDASATLRNSAIHNTTIDVPLAGSAANNLTGGTFVFTKAATFTGPTAVTSGLAFSVDNPLGASANNRLFVVEA
jgi:hypothetical protein